MNAVVVEVKKNKAVVLTDDGSFQKIRGSFEVGQTIECDDKIVQFEHKNKHRILMRTAAAFAVVVIGCGLYYNVAYAASTVVVSNADSSITISLNRLGRVLKVESDGDGENDVVDLLYDSGIQFSNLSDALQIVSETIETEDDEIEISEVTIDAANSSTYEKIYDDVQKAGFKVADSDGEISDTNDSKTVDENVPDDTADENISEGSENDFADGKTDDEKSNDTIEQKDESDERELKEGDETKPEAQDDNSLEELYEKYYKAGDDEGFNEGDEYMEPHEGQEDGMGHPPVMHE